MLSVVIPVFNEQHNIHALTDALLPVLKALDVGYEIIFVDDGSHDATWTQIEALARNHSQIYGLSLSRNFGHQHALLAGLQHASGQAIISMDGDLQHPPELIPQLFAAWQQGFKVVHALRVENHSKQRFKVLSSKYFYRFFSALSDVPIEQGSSDFRLIDRSLLQQLNQFNDSDLFLRGAIQWLGFPSTTIHFQPSQRFSGSSKYSLRKMTRFASGAILSFSVKPLYIGIWLGVITSALAFLELVYVLIQYMLGNTVSGWASTMAVLSFLFGVLFIMLGIMGIYLSRIHRALQNRPKYIIAKSTEKSPETQC